MEIKKSKKKHSIYNTLFVIDTRAAISLPSASGDINICKYINIFNDNHHNAPVQRGNKLTYNCEPKDTIIWRTNSINQSDIVNFIDVNNFKSHAVGIPVFKLVEKNGNIYCHIFRPGSGVIPIKFTINSDTSRIYFCNIELKIK